MMLKKELLKKPGLYLVTDSGVLKGKDLFDVLSGSLKAGLDIVQFRDKEASDADFFKTGLRIKSLLKNKALFIINDRVCMALALDADGVHLGSMDAGRDSQKNPWQEKDNRMLSRFPGGGPEGAKTGRRLYCHRRYFSDACKTGL